MIKSTGKIIYNPNRDGLKKKANNWVIVLVDPKISEYYRYFVNKNLSYYKITKEKICQPSWGTHISIVRGDNDLRWGDKKLIEQNWLKLNHKQIEFEYDIIPKLTDNKEFFYLDVMFKEFYEIRDSLGLKTTFEPHMTIGRIWNMPAGR